MRASIVRATSLVFFGLVLAACSKPQPPPTDEPPEPQAAAHSGFSDAIQQPIDQAKAVEGVVQEAADKQRAEMDAAAN